VQQQSTDSTFSLKSVLLKRRSAKSYAIICVQPCLFPY
jgi:hypothetical protein